MTKTHELKIAPEEEMNFDRTTVEDLGKHFIKGFRVGFGNIIRGNTQEEIDRMANVLKKEEDND
ncbi:hypothetical protein D0533_08050 [Listeria monocytogenes]|nr:hypothetical protein [Listeria monocytogenes]EAF3256993.1 hypothetical protein [Listeria monocytogenes]EAH0640819.1 hypothetical protein [Listeria monocytogenes]EHZ1075507.1 hypothetical protein [Listeria monocytogenes]EIN9175146.1 hypothetical protein [Listeria monocytogenes]